MSRDTRRPFRLPPVPLRVLLAALGALAALGILECVRQPAPAPDSPPGSPPELTLRVGVSLLAPDPDWDRLKAYDGILDRGEIEAELDGVYTPDAGHAVRKGLVEIEDDCVVVATRPGEFLRIRFAPSAETPRFPGRYWRAVRELPPASDPVARPLEHLRVAIDPGHIGGAWAKTEERWYRRPGQEFEVKEGELTLDTARHLGPMLEDLGATVALVRDSLRPVTPRRPTDFRELAAADLRARGIDPTAPDPPRHASVEWHAEKLFYRSDEIRARGRLVNEVIRPDLVLCLHFNAEAWADPSDPALVARNHLHLLVNGTYARGELVLQDQRLDMLERLFQRIHPEELAVSTTVAAALAESTGLPPYAYLTPNARRVGPSPYVYARNLLANRIYRCPTLYLEPYVMNNAEVYARLAEGDYPGTRTVAGGERPSIFREYASGVATGLARHYRTHRQP